MAKHRLLCSKVMQLEAKAKVQQKQTVPLASRFIPIIITAMPVSTWIRNCCVLAANAGQLLS